MDMRTPTAEVLESLPRVTMTSDMPWRPEDIDNEHAVSDLKNPDKETTDFGYGEVNETGEIMKSVQFVDEEELPDLIPNPSTWYVKKPCPHHGQVSKKVAPCQKEKHPNALWGEILEPFSKFEPDILGFEAANMQQMYGTQFDVNNFDAFVDLCIHEAQGVQVKPAVCDLKRLGPNFGFVNEE